MRLVTFEEPHDHSERLGILVSPDGESLIIDANYAYNRMLKGGKGRSSQKLADSMAPTDMLGLLRSGRKSFAALREVERFALRLGLSGLSGPKKERAIFRLPEVIVMAPVPRPGKIIHTAGHITEHAKEGKGSGRPVPQTQGLSFPHNPPAKTSNRRQNVPPR